MSNQYLAKEIESIRRMGKKDRGIEIVLNKIDEWREEGRIGEYRARRLKTAYMVKNEILKRDWYNKDGEYREPVRDLGLYKFSKGDFKNRDLSNLDLTDTLLVSSDSRNAELNGAKLTWSDISCAYLSGAKLNVGGISHTDLEYTILSYANQEIHTKRCQFNRCDSNKRTT